ncbi:Arf GTPase activating protein [Heterostelium album PN500]|uniref:Arf GTPase activating protein n=1 Tax=Heterostelium pallidum (strain ATCC 26659 / Pp 5 / PN500) TaxID=670386 RepID=D3B391_HETP5|nr:Arf GTPase activating protein [Heterostelium album PN500]EFA83789.1 Arf GTPase activating protein [Heterostelium album PN500]|eukprot:XP_020435906.1 Arf GTPase activating protein [Heterostelium album PN500]
MSRPADKNEKVIRDLLKLPENMKCMDCPIKGPVYACLDLATFVCQSCSGIHSNMGRRVKSVSMGSFKPEEIQKLQNGGNKAARAYWLARWRPDDYPEPEEGDSQRIRKFIELKYNNKQWVDNNSGGGGGGGISQPKIEPLSNILGPDIPPIRVAHDRNSQQFQQQDLFNNNNNNNQNINSNNNNNQQQQQYQQQQQQQPQSIQHTQVYNNNQNNQNNSVTSPNLWTDKPGSSNGQKSSATSLLDLNDIFSSPATTPQVQSYNNPSNQWATTNSNPMMGMGSNNMNSNNSSNNNINGGGGGGLWDNNQWPTQAKPAAQQPPAFNHQNSFNQFPQQQQQQQQQYNQQPQQQFNQFQQPFNQSPPFTSQNSFNQFPQQQQQQQYNQQQQFNQFQQPQQFNQQPNQMQPSMGLDYWNPNANNNAAFSQPIQPQGAQSQNQNNPFSPQPEKKDYSAFANLSPFANVNSNSSTPNAFANQSPTGSFKANNNSNISSQGGNKVNPFESTFNVNPSMPLSSHGNKTSSNPFANGGAALPATTSSGTLLGNNQNNPFNNQNDFFGNNNNMPATINSQGAGGVPPRASCARGLEESGIIFCGVCLFNIVFAQDQYPVDQKARCEPYVGDPPSKKLCDGKIVNPKSIYVAGDQTQEDLQKSVEFLFGFLSTSGSDECKQSVNTTVGICAMYLRECEYVTLSTNQKIAVPVRPCKHSCTEMFNFCQITPNPLLNCDLQENPPVGKIFVEQYSSYNLSSVDKSASSNFTVQCEDVSQAVAFLNLTNSNQTENFSNCLAPLVPYNTSDRAFAEANGVQYTSNVSICAVTCPAPIFTRETWKRIYAMNDTLTYLSFASSIFLVITYGFLNPKKSRYDRINLCFIAAVCMICVSGLIVSFNGTEKTLCPTSYRFSVFTDAPCTASAFILHIFAIYAVLYWAIMAFEIWWGIKKVGGFRKDLFWYYAAGTSVIAWIFPLIAIGKKQYHSGLANVFCWIDSGKYQVALFWVPLGVILLVGATFMFLLMHEIYKIVSASSGSKGKNAKIEILKVEAKPIIGVILYFSLFLYLFIYTRYVQDNYKRFIAGIPEWFNCVVQAQGGKGDPYSCIVKGPNPAGVGYFIFCVRVFALVCFLLNGISSRSLKIWRESFVFNNRLVKQLRSFTSKMTSSTVSQSTNNSNTTFPSAPSQYDSRNSLDTPYSIELREEES